MEYSLEMKYGVLSNVMGNWFVDWWVESKLWWCVEPDGAHKLLEENDLFTCLKWRKVIRLCPKIFENVDCAKVKNNDTNITDSAYSFIYCCM
ncbi:MAG: hypothetical protein LBQ98_00400 [Nitrososphaerota archaeon]|nr:hypothetical protein [Nitrososphaerota archaeon]